ncbi:MAG: ferritin-like domain-containing protein [Peptococcaceae bacterium]|nr:ferritin-like domain-containing protein [Peptococcaceae bacterium]
MISQLKQIYELERFQINYYMSQLSTTEDTVLNKALIKIIETEKKHIDFFTQRFTEAGIDISKISTTIANLAGSIIGESVELTGPINICRIGVALEGKALNAYYDLIENNHVDSDLLEILIDFQLDKEFQMLWLQHYAGHLKNNSSRKNKILNDSLEEHPTVNINMRWI